MQPQVHVAVGVLLRNSTCLIARRHEKAHMGGLWEFPGGKVEDNENVEAALRRELEEELGIVVGKSEPLLCIEHSYTDKTVVLHTYVIEKFSGEPQGREQQPMQWVAIADLNQFDFPAANVAIVEALQRC